MKKKSTRIMGGVVVLALLTTCLLSGTFAKYSTSGTGSASASLASWGVQVANSISLPLNGYNGKGQKVVISDKLAPGSRTDVTKPALTGTPDVATKVTYTVDSFNLSKYVKKSGTLYVPLTVTIFKNNGTTKWSWVTEIKASDYVSGTNFDEAGFCAAVNAKLAEVRDGVNGGKGYYEVGTDLSTIADDVTIRVEWKDTGNDELDTKLAEKGSTFNMSVTAKVDQYYQ